MNLIDRNIEMIFALCLKHNVKKLFVFGSILTDQLRKNSDIDLIVDFHDIDLYEYADNYFSLKESLETLFRRNVDLLRKKQLKIHI